MVELLATLVLLGVMVALAAPAMSGMVKRSRLDGVTGQLTGDIAYARMQAVRRAQPVDVIIRPSSYTIRQRSPVVVLKDVDLAVEHPDLVLRPGAATTDTLRFNSRGILNGTPFVVTVQTGTRTDQIEVLTSGRAYRVY